MKRKIYALGFFDGVHAAHQALLWECVEMARRMDAIPAAITFNKHPKAMYTAQIPPLITATEDRIALLRFYGIEDVQVLPVSEVTMVKHWRTFLNELQKQGAVGFVCGDDFRFGHKGIGDAEKLQAFCWDRGMPCVVVQEQTIDGSRISSSRIRKLLETGDLEGANRLLGHPHVLGGYVVPGRHIGRTIGVPTANILIPEGVSVPKLGVYACTCVIDGKTCIAVTNVGHRPTVGGHQTRAESWILDFEGDLYGKHITLKFHKFLRPEQKFGSLEELKTQIQADAAEAYKLLR